MKTLKEIEFEEQAHLIVESDDLRDLAKEEIKKLEKERADVYEEIGSSMEGYGIECEINWIKHFFNLEEE